MRGTILKKVAIVLSGCGHKDGSEITETTSTLIALSQNKAKATCFAPNIEIEPINHISNERDHQNKRSLLTESARIARGDIHDLKELKEKDFDAIVFPGGYGVVTNLSDWKNKGHQCHVLPEIEKALKEFHAASKPIGAICIAPILVAKVLGKKHVELTIGEDQQTAQEIEKTGAKHITCPVDDFITDRENKVITTPAYMYNAQPYEVFKGISGLIKELVEMA